MRSRCRRRSGTSGACIGPALAGLVIGLGGYELAFVLNTLSFFAVFAVVASFRLPPPMPARRGSRSSGRCAKGARFVRGDAALRFVVACMALNSLLAAPFIALIPAVALDVFHEEKLGTAALVTAQGLGAVCMGLALATLFARFGTRRVLQGVLYTLPVALVLYALAPTLPLAVVAIFFVGGLYLGSLSSFTTVAQLRAPAELRGPSRERAHDAHRRAVSHRQHRAGRHRRRDRPPRHHHGRGRAARRAAAALARRSGQRAADAIGDTITTAAATGGPDAVIAP